MREIGELPSSLASSTGMCGRCYDEVDVVFLANCSDPSLLKGGPIGMYHCPDCGAMVVAGIPHPPLCSRCWRREHHGFDSKPLHGEVRPWSEGFSGIVDDLRGSGEGLRCLWGKTSGDDDCANDPTVLRFDGLGPGWLPCCATCAAIPVEPAGDDP